MGSELTPIAAPPTPQEAADEYVLATSEATVEVDLYQRSIVAVREHRATERLEAERMLLTRRS